MDYDNLLNQADPQGNPAEAFALGRQLEAQGALPQAASAYDRAYGLAPEDSEIGAARQRVLDALAVTEHGITFRYVPAGSFLMGSEDGDPDERPVHRVKLDAYWLAETSIDMETYARLLDIRLGQYDEAWLTRQDPDWINDLLGQAPDFIQEPQQIQWALLEYSTASIYCENHTRRGGRWHGSEVEPEEETDAGWRWREPEEAPYRYDAKPLVGVGPLAGYALGSRLSTERLHYGLPTEAQWEKAARGGLIGKPYPWGDAPISPERADYGRFEEFSIRLMRDFAPNGYGLIGMCGGVWEWTADFYDAEFYRESPLDNPTGPATAPATEYAGPLRVLRGGSWADDPEAVTVSFRDASGEMGTANHGFRLCRVDVRR